MEAHQAEAKDHRMGRRGVSVCDLCRRSDRAGSANAECKLNTWFISLHSRSGNQVSPYFFIL